MTDSYHGGVVTLLNAVATFNPHAAFTLTFAGGEREEWTASDPTWMKWRPHDPTSPHWYTPDTLSDQIAAHLRDGDGTRPVRDFVATFAGLSGSAKRKAAASRAGLPGTISPHFLRHAAASHAIQRGASLPLVQQTLGHTNLSTTGRYTHINPTDSIGNYLPV